MGKVFYENGLAPYRFEAIFVDSPQALSEEFALNYSRMKYGYPPAVRYMAEIFCDRIVKDQKVMQVAKTEGGLLIAGSVYYGVPRGATVLGWEVAKTLNKRGIKAQNFKINYTGDHNMLRGYAAANSETRAQILNNFNFWLSKTALRKVRGKTLLILDDACMTGVHEKMIFEALKISPAKSTMFGYLLNFSDEMAENNPHFEEKLNRFGNVKPLDALVDLLVEVPGGPALYINARTVRLILSAAEKGEDVLSFYQKLPNGVLLKIYEAAVSKDRYSHQTETTKGFMILKYYMLARGLKESLRFRNGLEIKEILQPKEMEIVYA